MNCKQARRLFGAYWDDEVTQAEREWVETHFAGCRSCRDAYDDLARTIELVASLPRAEVSRGFAEQTLTRARRAAAEPDRSPTAAPRWIPITATALLLAVLGGMILQWAGMPLAPVRNARPGLAQESFPQATLVAPVRVVPGSEGAMVPRGAEGMVAGAVAEIPDSLFDHSEDVEFILDSVTLRKGRAQTVVHAPRDAPRGQQATITF